METNDMKDMWKSGIDSHIKFYSDTELSEIIVKSAGKAMKPIQLGGGVSTGYYSDCDLYSTEIDFWS